MADFSGTTTLAGDGTWSAAGDIAHATADDTGTVLSAGSTNAVLQITGGLPAWQTSVTIPGNLTVEGTTTLGTVSAGVWNGTALVKAYIGADAIDGSKIEDDAIDSEHYTDGSIDNVHLADDAVDSDELAAGAIDTAHIADNQVTLAKMAGITRGSIIYGDASGDPAALAKGTEDYVLTAGADDVSWAAAGGGGATVEAIFFTRTAAAASGTVTYGGAGGTPSGAIIVTRSATTASSFTIGVTEGDLTDHITGYYAFDSTPVGLSNSSQVTLAHNAAGDNQQYGQMSAWTSTGGTITWVKVGSGEAVSGYIIWLR